MFRRLRERIDELERQQECCSGKFDELILKIKEIEQSQRLWEEQLDHLYHRARNLVAKAARDQKPDGGGELTVEEMNERIRRGEMF